jgi:tRNA A37 threonylcarbamoyladenosine synthetase subunit TsaC/SUA5/YrdC
MVPNAKHQEDLDILSGEGGMLVSPTKVGYIIMTPDFDGLKRKFSAKQQALNKPGVVLCSSMQQLRLLAQTNDEVEAVYQKAGTTTFWMMDRRGTSCFYNQVWRSLGDHCPRWHSLPP